MICEKCSKEYPDELKACPYCKKKERSAGKTKQQKQEKRARAMVIVLMCFVAVAVSAVTALAALTDIFTQPEEVKAVALVLSAEEKTELEGQLTKLVPLAREGYDSKKMGIEELLGFMKPYSEKGLYCAFGYDAAVASLQPDPAQRFGDEEGNYNYYKVTKNRVDGILSQFEIETDHTVNLEDVYYYDGYYYFAGGVAQSQSSEVTALITSSKRIQDGRYYVTCALGDKTVYVVAGKQQDGDRMWKFHEISTEPIFDQLGIMIKDETQSLFDYEIKNTSFEAVTEDGKLFARYVLSYPVFYGDTAGEAEANRFYESIVSYYQQQASSAEEGYKQFVKDKGIEASLPLEVNYSGRVTYAAGDYIGVCNEISQSVVLYESDTEEEDDDPIVPSEKTMECYIFDTETGAYVTKDTIIGKDYQLLEELLYRIYGGYDYSALLDEEKEDVADIPDDDDDLGEDIYDSASTLCDEGYMFCYINESGYREDVIIPFGTQGIFRVDIG